MFWPFMNNDKSVHGVEIALKIGAWRDEIGIVYSTPDRQSYECTACPCYNEPRYNGSLLYQMSERVSLSLLAI